MRSLVDRITLVPENGTLSIVLRGDLAAILSFAANSKKAAPCEGGLVRESLVAGTGYHRYPYGLAVAV
ncbi:hypothetical protein KXS07_20985 [Inquilinus limosus]|uniref:hypothetical protein n=1 Tax=Inquilinus limosus TaxID=171674 RepID=UPI003F156DCF